MLRQVLADFFYSGDQAGGWVARAKMLLDRCYDAFPHGLPEARVGALIADDGEFAPRRDDEEEYGVTIVRT